MTRYIVSYPNILDGEPVISGTRIPVVEFLLLLKEGYTLLEIQKMYSHVEPHTFERVLEEVAAGVSTRPTQYTAQAPLV